MPNTIDFSVLKSVITMEMVLDHYGIKQLRKKNDSLTGPCPIHHGDNKNAFHVSLSKNVWVCFTRCHSGGSVIDFIAAMEGLSRNHSGTRQAGLLLHQWFQTSTPRCNLTPVPATDVNPPLSFVLTNLDRRHSYLQQRGIDPATANHFGIGFYSRSGIMSGRIAIPVHDHTGQLVAYVGRSVTNHSHSKYRFPAGFRKSLVLYNFHRVTNSRSLILVEGFFDVFRLHQLGYPNAVALMGSSMSTAQETLIINNTDHVTLMFDGDPAGRACTETLSKTLSDKIDIQVIRLPNGIQPEHLTPPDAIKMRLRAS